MTKTIARTHRKKAAAVQAAVKYVRLYNRGEWTEEATSHAGIAWLFEQWQDSPHARLTVEEDGQRWAVHFHSNRFAYLYAYDYPERRAQELKAKEEAAAARPAPVAVRKVQERSGAAVGARPARGAGVLAEARAMAAQAPAVGPQAAQTAAAVHERHISRRIVRRDALTEPVKDLTGGVTAWTVQQLRNQGYDDEQIRARFTEKFAEAVAAGNPGRAAVAESMLGVFAGIVADEAAAAAAERAAGVSAAAPVAELEAAPVGEEHQDDEEKGAAVEETGRGWRAPAWWEKPEEARALSPADVDASRDLPPHEEGYVPELGARSYTARRVRAALEAAGLSLRGAGDEFPLFVGDSDPHRTHVSVVHLRGSGTKPRKGPARDRWEKRRAQALIALVDAGMEDVTLMAGGVAVRVPRPAGAATVVQLGERDYGEQFEGEHIEQPVSFPQYPQITGWVMRRKWGRDYRGPMTPWMFHTGSGEVVGATAKDERQAAEMLAARYGLMTPVRLWQS
jgi:hypothetical protein